MRQDADSLIGQILAANVLLVTLTLFAASVAAGLDLDVGEQRYQFMILALAILLTLCVNMWMLKRRFAPLERLIAQVESVDPSEPQGFDPHADPIEEIDRLSQSFRRLLERIEAERRRSATLVLRAQEEERRRVARDLHDEVNQALTAILLRLEALSQDAPPEVAPAVSELKRLVGVAMDELLDLARQLRPTVLDDHGLKAALEAQVRGFEQRSGVAAALVLEGEPDVLGEDQQTAIYRIAQEALSNAGRHADAHKVAVALRVAEHGTRLQIRDDGQGFDPVVVGDGLGLDGMAERARLIDGALDVRSAPGDGTEITLRLP